MSKSPDFWLSVHDTWWHHLPVDAVACTIIDGPRPMIEGYRKALRKGAGVVEQWLVQVEPAVRDSGVTTSRVLVDHHPSSVRQRPEGWELPGTGVYPLHPSVPVHQRSFTSKETIAGHKMRVTSWRPNG